MARIWLLRDSCRRIRCKFQSFIVVTSAVADHQAGASWDGQSATHVHMSNTSIGDVELSERTYPMIIRQYSLREGSGGNGRHKGGEGCIRAVEFTREVDCAILSDRRTNAPYGMDGGEPGARGKNVWIKNRNGVKTTINLGGRNQMRCMPGDMVVISE